MAIIHFESPSPLNPIGINKGHGRRCADPCVYQKPHAGIIFVLVDKIPCSRTRIPCSAEIIPCSVTQGIRLKAFEFARVLALKISHRAQIRRNSLLISLLAGNLRVETGSHVTASATTHSRATGDFLKLRGWPAFSGIKCGCSISAKGQLNWEPVLALLSLASKSGCPATETVVSRDQFDLRPYCGMRPSIWLWRDHSADRSQRRTTPIP